MRKEQGFTLIELMIVVAIIAIIAAIAIPSLLNARKAGNEASAISSLRTLCTVNQQYRTRFGSYATGLNNLSATNYIDGQLGSGTKSGYVFTYGGAANFFNDTATTETDATTGDRRFFVDHSGVIRAVPTGNPTSTSPPID